MKKFCEFLRDHPMKLIYSFKKDETITKKASGIA